MEDTSSASARWGHCCYCCCCCAALPGCCGDPDATDTSAWQPRCADLVLNHAGWPAGSRGRSAEKLSQHAQRGHSLNKVTRSRAGREDPTDTCRGSARFEPKREAAEPSRVTMPQRQCVQWTRSHRLFRDMAILIVSITCVRRSLHKFSWHRWPTSGIRDQSGMHCCL